MAEQSASRSDFAAIIDSLSLRLGEVASEYVCKCGTNDHGCQHCTEWVKAVLDAKLEAYELTSARSERLQLKDDVPLKCEVIDGAIQLVIGAKVLAHATNICPAFYDAENDRGRYRVTDPAVFAKEVERVLNHESEDGSTRLTKMMDEAVEHAIEYGAEGVEENTAASNER